MGEIGDKGSLRKNNHKDIITGLFTAAELLVERYEVIKLLKAGGMGKVYKARDVQTGEIVAVKEMLLNVDDSDEEKYARKKFLQESNYLARLKYPGIPELQDFFVKRDNQDRMVYYMVMTFIEGDDLETIMEKRRGKPLPAEQAADYFRQMLLILKYLHENDPPVVYRDLKPSNVIVRNNRVFLVDFGIAADYKKEKPGTVIGTPGYAAPEQYQGMSTPQSDLYSLGVLMHYILTGNNPERKDNALFKFLPIREWNPNAPEVLEKIVLSMTCLKAAERPKSAGEVLERLHPFFSLIKMTPAGPVSVRIPWGKFSQYRALFIIALFLLINMAALLFYSGFNPFFSKSKAPWIDSLEDSIKKNDIVTVKKYISQGGSVDYHFKDTGGAPLHIAVKHRRMTIAGILLSHGANVNARNNLGETPLHIASQNGDLRMAALLLEKSANVNAVDRVGQTPLIKACKKGRNAVVELLLEKGADVCLADNNGQAPIHHACRWGHSGIAGILLKKGSPVNLKDSLGVTPLIIASANARFPVIRLLVANKADVNVRNKKGMTAMDYVARNKQREIEGFLKRHAR